MPTNMGAGQQSAMTKQDEIKLLGDKAQQALDAYRGRALPMFIFYQISFWATLATILSGMLAVFSRFGSFMTWLLSFVRPRSLCCKILVIDNRDTDLFALHRRRCASQHSDLHRFRRRDERYPPPLPCSSDRGHASTWGRLARRSIRLGQHDFLAV